MLRHCREVGMHVPKEIHPWSAQLQAAARRLQQTEQRQQASCGQQQQQPVQLAQPAPGQPPAGNKQQQQQQPGSTPLDRLAAAAQLTQRQATLGLAGGRRQRLASFSCLVVAEAVEGAGGRRSNRSDQLARFGDVPQQEQQEQDEASSVLCCELEGGLSGCGLAHGRALADTCQCAWAAACNRRRVPMLLVYLHLSAGLSAS